METFKHPHQHQHHHNSHRPNLLIIQVLYGLLIFQTTIVQTSFGQTSMLQDPQDYYYVGCFKERTDLWKETSYAKTPQACVDYCEHQTYSYAILSGEHCFCSNTIQQEDRQDEQLCNIRCLADKSHYCGGVSVQSYYSTMLAKMQQQHHHSSSVKPTPNNLRIANSTENTLLIVWDAYKEHSKIHMIMDSGGANDGTSAIAEQEEITNFVIKSAVKHTYSSLPFFPQPEFIVQNTETSFEITDLHPATEYNVSVAAMCGLVVCGNATIVGTTEVGIPSPKPHQPKILNRTDTTITVEIQPIRNDNGPVTKVLIIVERLDDALSQSFDTELLGSWQKAQDDGLPYYIAAELDYQQSQGGGEVKEGGKKHSSRQFIVGDGKRYERYLNPPLDSKESNHIHISLGVVSTLNGNTKTLYTRSTHDQHSSSAMETFTYATFDSGRESIIALTVTCVIFGTCLILSLLAYFYLRYKTYQTRRTANRNAHEMTMQQPIIERENNGYVVEDELLPTTVENFKQQLKTLVDGLDSSRRLPRNALRMNINEIIAEGRYGEVITGKLIAASDASSDCQLHVLALDDLTSQDQAHLLQEFRNLTRLQRHDHILDFYGISASADWFYFVFEHQSVSLKRRLIESRRAPNSAPVQRLTALSEELILQWIYEIANALDYLSRCKVVHKQLCSHNIYVLPNAVLKLAPFGPIPYVNNQRKVDISRWLAPEALRYQHYSSKSDIWSFACVAWECCAIGGTPYANITSSQLLLEAIKSGSRPARPSYVYEDLYQLLLNCWQLEPSERVSFEDIAYNIRQLMTSPRHALCFDRLPDATGNNHVIDTLPFYLPMLEVLN